MEMLYVSSISLHCLIQTYIAFSLEILSPIKKALTNVKISKLRCCRYEQQNKQNMNEKMNETRLFADGRERSYVFTNKATLKRPTNRCVSQMLKYVSRSAVT